MAEDCVVTGVTLNADNQPAAGIRITALSVQGVDMIISAEQIHVSTSDASGIVRAINPTTKAIIPDSLGFVLPQGATVVLDGFFTVNGVSFRGGYAVTIPMASTVALIDLVAAATFPTPGAIVRSNGTAGPHMVGDFDYSTDFTLDFSVAGKVGIELAGGGGGGAWGSITGTLSAQTDLQNALNAKAALASPALTGTPTAPTAVAATNTTQIATTAFVRTEVANLVAASPSTLDTLNELAAALGNDPNFATTIATSLGLKANTSSLAAVALSGSASDLSTGTLPDARFPAMLPAASGVNLTALNASNLGSGTVPLARLSGITNTEISGAAAIAYSKLSLTGAILNADLAGSIAYSKLSLTGAILNADLAGSIALSKLSITGTPDGTKFLRDDGAWTAISSGGATTALDNLASVAINTSLLPASTQSLGSATFPWLSSFVGNTTQYESVTQSAGLITHSALGSATNIGFLFTPKGTGGLSNPGAGAGSERFGAAAVASGAGTTVMGSAANAGSNTNAVVIGDTAAISGGSSVSIGHGATAGAGGVSIGLSTTGNGAAQAIVIGNGANVSSAGGIAIGLAASLSGSNNLVIGHSASCTASAAIALGSSAVSSQANAIALGAGALGDVANLFAIGSNGNPINHIRFGSSDVGFSRIAANIIRPTNGTTTGAGALQFLEMTTPSAPATNNVILYAEDNGSGKTRLMAIFPTGAAQQVAIEP